MSGGDSSAIAVELAPGPFLQPVLTRIVGALAARANLPVDRLNDAVLISDALAATAPAHVVDGGRVTMVVSLGPRVLDVRIGPLVSGSAARIVGESTLPGVGDVIGRLADEVHSEESPQAAYLNVRVRG